MVQATRRHREECTLGDDRQDSPTSCIHKDSKRQAELLQSAAAEAGRATHWLTLDEIPQGKLVRRGLARGFDIGVREHATSANALSFQGTAARARRRHLHFPRADRWRLPISTRRRRCARVGRPAWHDGKSCDAALSKGEHPLSVTHIYDDTAGEEFRHRVGRPWFCRGKPIPLESLRVVDDGAYPRPVVKAEAPGDGTGRVAVTGGCSRPRGEQDGAFPRPAATRGERRPHVEIRWPAATGSEHLWARIIFDEQSFRGFRAHDSRRDRQARGRRMDRATSAMQRRPPACGRPVRRVPVLRQRHAHRTRQSHRATSRPPAALTTTTASHGEPVNPAPGWASPPANTATGWTGMGPGLPPRADRRRRACARPRITRISARGGSRSYELPKGRPWLRIVRQGNIWTAWTSADGKQWELGAYQFKKIPAADGCRAVFQRPAAGCAGALPRQRVGVFDPSPAPRRTRCRRFRPSHNIPLATPDRRGDGPLRCASGGGALLRRSDFSGPRMAARPGRPPMATLTGDDPRRPQRGDSPGGSANHAACSAAGGRCGKPPTAGRRWAKLGFDGDFDGAGPSALCGEVVAFDLRPRKRSTPAANPKASSRAPTAARHGLTWALQASASPQ